MVRAYIQPMDKRGSMDSIDNSAALQETRATYLPQEGERPEWEIEDTVQVMDDEEDEVRRQEKRKPLACYQASSHPFHLLYINRGMVVDHQGQIAVDLVNHHPSSPSSLVKLLATLS